MFFANKITPDVTVIRKKFSSNQLINSLINLLLKTVCFKAAEIKTKSKTSKLIHQICDVLLLVLAKGQESTGTLQIIPAGKM